MKLANDFKPEKASIECSEELQAKKQIILGRQKKMLSELGKTVAKLKNGLYPLERLPED